MEVRIANLTFIGISIMAAILKQLYVRMVPKRAFANIALLWNGTSEEFSQRKNTYIISTGIALTTESKTFAF
jgi:hypothetical protein